MDTQFSLQSAGERDKVTIPLDHDNGRRKNPREYDAHFTAYARWWMEGIDGKKCVARRGKFHWLECAGKQVHFRGKISPADTIKWRQWQKAGIEQRQRRAGACAYKEMGWAIVTLINNNKCAVIYNVQTPSGTAKMLFTKPANIKSKWTQQENSYCYSRLRRHCIAARRGPLLVRVPHERVCPAFSANALWVNEPKQGTRQRVPVCMGHASVRRGLAIR